MNRDRVACSPTIGHYPRVDEVARRFGALTGRTPAGAHQKLLSLPLDYAYALAAHVGAGAWDRLERFEHKANLIRERIPSLSCTDAHLLEERQDGTEDALYAELQADPTNDTKYTAWQRAALAHVRALQTKLKAEATVRGRVL